MNTFIFFQYLFNFLTFHLENIVLIFEFSLQKKKKVHQKEKSKDGVEDEDVMLKLKKLSVQSSDEEGEQGLIIQDLNPHN